MLSLVSHHLLCCEWDEWSVDHLVALQSRIDNQGPGLGPSPDLVKIDARDGKGLLMDYDVSLNMKTELSLVRSTPRTRRVRVLTELVFPDTDVLWATSGGSRILLEPRTVARWRPKIFT